MSDSNFCVNVCVVVLFVMLCATYLCGGVTATIEMLNFDLMAANSLLPQLPGDKDPLAHWAGKEICILPHSCVDHSTLVAT
jgi:hypothetical protein